MKTAALIISIAAGAGSVVLSAILYRMYDSMAAVARHLLQVEDDAGSAITDLNFAVTMLERNLTEKHSTKPKKATATKTPAKKAPAKKVAAKKTTGRPRKGA